jgi:hypothetical protein
MKKPESDVGANLWLPFDPSTELRVVSLPNHKLTVLLR